MVGMLYGNERFMHHGQPVNTGRDCSSAASDGRGNVAPHMIIRPTQARSPRPSVITSRQRCEHGGYFLAGFVVMGGYQNEFYVWGTGGEGRVA